MSSHLFNPRVRDIKSGEEDRGLVDDRGLLCLRGSVGWVECERWTIPLHVSDQFSRDSVFKYTRKSFSKLEYK